MLLIGLISDTHSYLGDDVIKHLKDCDEIWHAGDIGDIATADAIEAIGPPVKMVWGNIDNGELKERYDRDIIWNANGLKVFMTHIGGYPGRYYKRVSKTIKEEQPGLYICGHSHILKVMRDKAHDVLHMNPGACGYQGFHKFRTLIKFGIEDGGKIVDARVVELGKRGAISK